MKFMRLEEVAVKIVIKQLLYGKEVYMKIYALYFSPTGGTKKVLDILISAWNCKKEYIDLSDRDNSVFDITFESQDICVVAVPSFSGRVPQFIIPKLQKLQGKGIKAMLITAYGNRAFDDTLLELKDTMESCGFICSCTVAAVTRHSVMPKYGKGRPDLTDIEELKEFSVKCKRKIEESCDTVIVPGNRPYRKYVSIPIIPKATKQCTNCGICYRRCPVYAIDSGNYHRCDSKKCISCLQCVTVCPRNARQVNPVILKLAEIKMKKLCRERKMNELYV